MHQAPHETHFQFEKMSRKRNISGHVLLMMNSARSSWRPRDRDNIIMDVISNASSNKDEEYIFYFVRLVVGNWRDNLINANRLL